MGLLDANTNPKLCGKLRPQRRHIVGGVVRYRFTVPRPFGHQPAPLVQRIAATVSGFRFVLDGMSRRHLDNVASVAGQVSRPIGE